MKLRILVVTITLVQLACAGENSIQPEWQSQSSQVETVDSSSNTGSPPPDDSPSGFTIQANKEYEFSCTSLAGKTQTVRAVVGILDGFFVATAVAPSQMGTWVIVLNGNGQILKAENCFADAAGPASHTGEEACKVLAPKNPAPAPYNTYTNGNGNPFQSCGTPKAV